MNAKEFFEKVVEMRYQQRQYFKTKLKNYLVESKRLEKEIDDEINREQGTQTKDPMQAKLF